MIYRGVRLIRRLEMVFGAEEQIASLDNVKKEDGKPLFNRNAIVSVYTSKSSTSIDKQNFADK